MYMKIKLKSIKINLKNGIIQTKKPKRESNFNINLILVLENTNVGRRI